MLRQLSKKAILAFKVSCHPRQMSCVAKSIKYAEYGEPDNVLRICEEELPDPGDNDVLVKVLVAPMNPADINTIQGKYPVKPKLPAVGGNEFVAEVVCVGKNVDHLKPKDRVVPNKTGIGTWRTHGVFPAQDLMKISSKIDTISAAAMTVNPPTAYRMLKDFVKLEPGDTVIQNGANSAVGQAVHQLCKAWGIDSVGVVRDRPDIAQLKGYLASLGATKVFTEEEVRTTDIFKKEYICKPKLALNCVGGKSSTEIARHLDTNGVHVTYGNMSREPVVAGTAALIFKNLSFVGFWMTKWTKENGGKPEKALMFEELTKLMEEEKLLPPVSVLVPMSTFNVTAKAVLNFKGYTGKKFLLNMEHYE